MSPVDRFELELPAALADVAGRSRPDYLTDILGRTAGTRQRPAWASLERWLPMDTTMPRAVTTRVPWRTLGVLALVALLVAAMLVAWAGSQHRVPSPFGPAANGLIPFERDGDIYLGDPETGATRLVVGGPANDHSASFSRDGLMLAWLRVTPAGEVIVAAKADGSGERVLTPDPPENLMLAAWVPRSDGIIVDHAVDGRQRLEILHVDGSPPTVIADDLPIDTVDVRPPDGTEKVVRAEVDGAWGLYSMKIDGTDRRLLAPATYTAGPPDQDLNSPAYSADGSRITYNRYVPSPESIQVWTMNADGTDQRRFNPDGPLGGWEGEAVPSPDGRWLVAWRVGDAQGGQIALFAADGSGDPIVLATVTNGQDWTWAPDSSWLLINPSDRGRGPQQILRLDGSPAITLPWKVNSEPDVQRLAP